MRGVQEHLDLWLLDGRQPARVRQMVEAVRPTKQGHRPWWAPIDAAAVPWPHQVRDAAARRFARGRWVVQEHGGRGDQGDDYADRNCSSGYLGSLTEAVAARQACRASFAL